MHLRKYSYCLQRMGRETTSFSVLVVVMLLLVSCSATKYVPEGRYLLDDVSIRTDNRSVRSSDLQVYLRQKPNSKWFSIFNTQLYIYDWSGRDSTKWINRALRRLGSAPVIYSEHDAERTRQEMTKAVQNMGYMRAKVEQTVQTRKKKLKLTYRVSTGKPYHLKSISYDIPDENIRQLLHTDSTSTRLKKGMVMDINVLDAERQRITTFLQQRGYYKFNKEYITYEADTVRNTYEVDLTMHLSLYRRNVREEWRPHTQYVVDRVNYITEYDALQGGDNEEERLLVDDSIHYKQSAIYFKKKLYLSPKTLTNNNRIEQGALYNVSDVQRTYNNFGRLGALKYTNIRFFEHEADSTLLTAYVMLTRAKHNSVSFGLEGTNSAGDLGAAASVSYTSRNLFKRAESLMLRLRGSYEAISSKQSGYKHENYKELGAEATLNFPRFVFPFLSNDFKRHIRAVTEFGLQYNYQLRPEFSRIVASAGWSYRWGDTRYQRSQHRFDLIDVNYLYMPWIDETFKNTYLDRDQNYILKYNYEDRFIVRMGYSYTYNSLGSNLLKHSPTRNSYSIRFNAESAGSLLYGLAKVFKMGKNAEGEHTLFNIPFAQYFRADVDWVKNFVIDERNSLVLHADAGIAIPFGNASVVPFEKRYFSGGANSVRGWSVRNLGPGTFSGDGNFLNQSGDIKLDFNIEYRTKLFWKLRGAVFVDAGNIWTIRDYDDQSGGLFKIDTFYKQIAVAYGLGLRLDLDFFILRFDGGMKAITREFESGKERYPIVNPKFSRDFAFHFAVGYPF